jgi:hypothetical protein
MHGYPDQSFQNPDGTQMMTVTLSEDPLVTVTLPREVHDKIGAEADSPEQYRNALLVADAAQNQPPESTEPKAPEDEGRREPGAEQLPAPGPELPTPPTAPDLNPVPPPDPPGSGIFPTPESPPGSVINPER